MRHVARIPFSSSHSHRATRCDATRSPSSTARPSHLLRSLTLSPMVTIKSFWKQKLQCSLNESLLLGVIVSMSFRWTMSNVHHELFGGRFGRMNDCAESECQTVSQKLTSRALASVVRETRLALTNPHKYYTNYHTASTVKRYDIFSHRRSIASNTRKPCHLS